jgi:plastocyanin
MQNKVIIGIAALALLGGGIWLFAKEDTPAPSPTPSPTNGETVIIYTNNGYTPNQLTVQRGETITFRNESSRDMWPASDPHPTHTIYPEFDSRGPIEPGETFAFTFTRVGTWGYHDHSNPFRTGTIIVLE